MKFCRGSRNGLIDKNPWIMLTNSWILQREKKPKKSIGYSLGKMYWKLWSISCVPPLTFLSVISNWKVWYCNCSKWSKRYDDPNTPHACVPTKTAFDNKTVGQDCPMLAQKACFVDIICLQFSLSIKQICHSISL